MEYQEKDRWRELRRRAEMALEGEPEAGLTIDGHEAGRLIQELRIAQAELEIQNEELRESQAALERSRKHYEMLFNGAPVGYVVLDRIGMIQQANEIFCELVDCPPAHIIHHSLRSFVVESERVVFDQQFPGLFTSRRPRAIEVALRRESGGAPIDARIEGTTLKNLPSGEGNQVNLLVTVSDVTASKSLERQLWESQKLEATGQLAGGIAHDFNNILTVIQATIEVARFDLPQDSPIRDYLRQIEDSGSRAAALVQQLMAFAQSDKGLPQVLDLGATPLLMESMLRRLIPESVRFEWKVEPDPFRIHIDPVKLDQVLTNLVLNARDAVEPSGLIRVVFGNVALGQDDRRRPPGILPGDFLAITVSDDGHGISPEVRDRIFEPFFTTKAQGKGTGLGLSTVYGIAAQNQGFIHVESTPGRGAEFTVFLPRTLETAPGKSPRPLQDDGLDGRERILLVEDDALVLALAKRLLARRGYQVQEFEDPEQAWIWFADHSGEVDVILSDVVMPGLSGPQLVQKMRQVRPDLPFLYMSGYHREESVVAQSQDEGVTVIRKPFDSVTLLDAVRGTLDGRQGGGRAGPS